jgi:hypothetical protein
MVTITLQVSEETERRLQAKASAAGKSVEAYIQDLAEREAQAVRLPLGPERTPEQRVAQWRAFASSRPARPVIADDSRESIYEGRGE